ncbi:MAG: hypothetical protein V7740_17595 [Pseudomonas marincola]
MAAMAIQAEAQVAQQTVETDCTDVDIDYQNSTLLTQAERIAAMDRALNRSLDKYDACVTEDADQSSGGGDGGGGGSGTAGAGQGQSTAASGISGTNKPPVTQAQPVPSSLPEDGGAALPAEQTQQLSNGKTPEDIPAANNDDILAQRIRSAAETETDPEKQERLWNEYRKYKGLPQK